MVTYTKAIETISTSLPGFVQSLCFLKMNGNLQASFADLETVINANGRPYVPLNIFFQCLRYMQVAVRVNVISFSRIEL